MVFQLVLSEGLTLQLLATIIVGAVSLATKHLLSAQIFLISFVDISLRGGTMSVSSLFPSALQVPRATSGGSLQYLVCLSLVSDGFKHSTSYLRI